MHFRASPNIKCENRRANIVQARWLIVTTSFPGQVREKALGARLLMVSYSRNKKLLTLERAKGQIKSTGTCLGLISKFKGLKRLKTERPTVRLAGVNCFVFSNISSGTA